MKEKKTVAINLKMNLTTTRNTSATVRLAELFGKTVSVSKAG